MRPRGVERGSDRGEARPVVPGVANHRAGERAVDPFVARRQRQRRELGRAHTVSGREARQRANGVQHAHLPRGEIAAIDPARRGERQGHVASAHRLEGICQRHEARRPAHGQDRTLGRPRRSGPPPEHGVLQHAVRPRPVGRVQPRRGRAEQERRQQRDVGDEPEEREPHERTERDDGRERGARSGALREPSPPARHPDDRRDDDPGAEDELSEQPEEHRARSLTPSPRRRSRRGPRAAHDGCRRARASERHGSSGARPPPERPDPPTGSFP